MISLQFKILYFAYNFNFHRLASTQLGLRTSSFSENSKPLSEMAQNTTTAQQKLAISASTPLLLIENKSIQGSTIPEESSRANSEVDLQRKSSSENTGTLRFTERKDKPSLGSGDLTAGTDGSLAAGGIDTDKSSSQSSLPIINVTDNEGVTTEGLEDDVMFEPEKSEISVQTDQSVLQDAAAAAVLEQKVVIVEQIIVQRMVEIIEPEEEEIAIQQIEIEVETHAEPSPLGEQTLSEDNMPKVIRKLSIQSEEQMLQEIKESEMGERQESLETQEELGEMSSDSFVPGYVAPAPTPAPSMAPLAEMDNDQEIDDESEELETAQPIEPKVVCEHQKKEKRRKKKHGEGTSGTPKKPDPVKGNPVCPWEDE